MNNAPPTRATLLLRLRDPHDDEAWNTFTKDYAPALYRFLRKRGLQDADAADLLQEVMRSVGLAISDLKYQKSKGGFRAWLFTITRNKLFSYLDRSVRRNQELAGERAEIEIQENALEEDTLSQAWEQEYQTQLLARAVKIVQPAADAKTWQAFQFTAIDHQPASEVAQKLNMSIGAVYVARSRITARLRDEVQRMEQEEEM